MGQEKGNVCNIQTLCFVLLLIIFITIALAVTVTPDRVFKTLLEFVGTNETWYVLLGFAVMAILLIVLFLPFWTLVLMCQGFVFGFKFAFLANTVALLVGAAASYWIGLHFKDLVREYLQTTFPTIDKFGEAMCRKGFWCLLLFRFCHIAMGVRNYVPVIFSVSFPVFMAAASIHSVWISVLFSLTGAGVRKAAETYSSDNYDGSFVEAFPKEEFYMLCVSIACTVVLSVIATMEYFRILRAPRRDGEHEPLIRPSSGP